MQRRQQRVAENESDHNPSYIWMMAKIKGRKKKQRKKNGWGS